MEPNTHERREASVVCCSLSSQCYASLLSLSHLFLAITLFASLIPCHYSFSHLFLFITLFLSLIPLHHTILLLPSEKRDLIDLVTRHISSQHRTASSRRPPPPPSAAQRPGPHTTNNNQSKHRSTPHTPTAPQDDGIRVRPSSNSSMGSIRVRPLDSIRVRPGRPSSPNPNTDPGIRVFASEERADSPSTSSPTSPTSDTAYPEGEEEECSRCPSDWTASCCSLDSCHNGTIEHPHHCPNHCSHRLDSSSQNSGEWVFVPDMNTPSAPPSESQGVEDSGSGADSAPIPLPHHGESAENGTPAEDANSPSEPSAPPQQQEEEQPSFAAPTVSSSSSTSSSAPTSAVSSPEPTKGVSCEGEMKETAVVFFWHG